MTLPDPTQIWFDTAALVSLAHAGNALPILRRRALGDRPRWVDAVEDEVTRGRQPHEHIAGLHLIQADTAWLGDYAELDEGQHIEAYELRDTIALPMDHPDEHLGEAQTVVLARDTHHRLTAGGGTAVVVAASDDRGIATVARNASAAGVVTLWSSAHVLAFLVQLGELTCDDAFSDYTHMVNQGRGLNRSLSRQDLCAGHIPPPRR